MLNKLSNETMGIQTRFNKIVGNKEINELSDEEIAESIKVRSELEDLNEDIQPLISKLGQRGIKRAFNPTLNTEKIDNIPDVEIEYGFLKEVYKIMGRISSPNSQGDVDGKKIDPKVSKKK